MHIRRSTLASLDLSHGNKSKRLSVTPCTLQLTSHFSDSSYGVCVDCALLRDGDECNIRWIMQIRELTEQSLHCNLKLQRGSSH